MTETTKNKTRDEIVCSAVMEEWRQRKINDIIRKLEEDITFGLWKDNFNFDFWNSSLFRIKMLNLGCL